MRRGPKVLLAGSVLAALVLSLIRFGRSDCYGRWQGFRYRLFGHHPDPDVDDLTLADRIRSTIGPEEKRLDLPHIHVMVEHHVALLHGEVAHHHEAASLERAVRRVSGVRGVESYLHVGLLRSDVRPSEGRMLAAPPSEAKRRLLAAAQSAGAEQAHAAEAVRATLAVLAERIPSGERKQLLGHLPDDVRAMLTSPRRAGSAAARMKTAAELVAAVIAEEVDPFDSRAAAIVAAVVAEVRRLVPEEADDVAAVLPHELRDLWVADTPARSDEHG